MTIVEAIKHLTKTQQQVSMGGQAVTGQDVILNNTFIGNIINLQAPCVLYIDRCFATLQRTLIYLINKYSSLPDICFTVHH